VSFVVLDKLLLETYDAQVASAPTKATANPEIIAGPPPFTKGVTKNLQWPSTSIPIVARLYRKALTGWQIPKYTSSLL
jgi:hypothetical protein